MSQLLPGKLIPHLGQLLSKQGLLRPGAHQRVERHAGCAVAPRRLARALLRCVSIKITWDVVYLDVQLFVFIYYCFCRPTGRELTERQIKSSLREIMMQKDLENVTCKEVSRCFKQMHLSLKDPCQQIRSLPKRHIFFLSF